MKKRHVVHHHHHKTAAARRTSGNNEQYLVIVRSWMLVVMFALMLGIGAIVGNLINQKLNETPMVAGAQTQLQR